MRDQERMPRCERYGRKEKKSASWYAIDSTGSAS